MGRNTADISPDPQCTSMGAAVRSISWDRQFIRRFGLPIILLALWGFPAAYGAGNKPPDASAQAAPKALVSSDKTRMWMTIDKRRFVITLANNAAARAFEALLPLTLNMEELNGNEKKKELAQPLPTTVGRPDKILTGDFLLWGDRTVVVFYQTFDSPYSYTPLGRIDDPAGLAQALGRGDVRVVFSHE